MSRKFNGGVKIPAAAGAGRVALSDAAGNLVWTPVPFTEVTTSADQSIPSGVMTTVSWSTVLTDREAWFNPLQPTRIVVGRTGLYLVTSNLAWQAASASTTSQRFTTVRRNGNFTVGAAARSQYSETDMALTLPVLLTAGDFIEARVFQDSGAALVLIRHDGATDLNRNAPRFSALFLGA